MGSGGTGHKTPQEARNDGIGATGSGNLEPHKPLQPRGFLFYAQAHTS